MAGGCFALDQLKNHINKGKGKEKQKVGEEIKLMSCYLQLQLYLIKILITIYRLARKIIIANLGGPVKRKVKGKETKETILSYNK